MRKVMVLKVSLWFYPFKWTYSSRFAFRESETGGLVV